MSLKQILIGIDQLGNTLCGGWADETISARSWRCRHEQPWGGVRWLVDKIFFWQQNHCQGAYESELRRMQSPPSERKPPTKRDSYEHSAADGKAD